MSRTPGAIMGCATLRRSWPRPERPPRDRRAPRTSPREIQMRIHRACLFLPLILLGSGVYAAADRANVGSSDFTPVLAPAPGQERVHVAAFRLDKAPVTNAQFLDFVRSHSQWRRDRVASLFADGEYLSHWAAPDALGEGALAQAPGTRVSWFAARAYCAASGAR